MVMKPCSKMPYHIIEVLRANTSSSPRDVPAMTVKPRRITTARIPNRTKTSGFT